MNHKEFFTQVQEQYQQNLPFVLYVKPMSKQIIGLLQVDDGLYNLTEHDIQGFVIAPFHGNEVVFFPKDKQCILKTDTNFNEKTEEMMVHSHENLGYNDFISLVEKGIENIENDVFQKVVLSRQIQQIFNNLDVFKSFRKAILTYPNAFKYLFFHPKKGIWLGATPEQLVKVNNRKFETVSLAGTQIFHENEIRWTNKEIEEQAIVTEFIQQSVAPLSKNLQVSEPFTVQAGNLAHIKTQINGVLMPNYSTWDLVQTLHPTPAVCGFPKPKALDFILQNEGYDRKFYTGFLGEWHFDFANEINENSDLYVNLRCMEFQENKVVLYVGCGITQSSDANKEYDETQHKSETMQKILS